MLDLPTLRKMVDSHEIDTVLVVFPDLQGRLVGKRVTGHYFLDHVAADGGAIECCNYLLAVDVDMTSLPGYEFANWEQGYGDVACRPDLSTLRTIPWLEADGARDLRPVRRPRRESPSRCRPAGSCSARSSGRGRRATRS